MSKAKNNLLSGHLQKKFADRDLEQWFNVLQTLVCIIFPSPTS